MKDRVAFALLCAVVFTIPWEKSVTLPGVGTITKVLGLLLVLAVGWTRRIPRGPNLPFVVAVVFVAWSALTWFWSYDPAATIARSLTYVQLLVLAWIVWHLCRTAEQQDRLLQMYVAGAGVASLATLARWLAQQQTYYRRYAAPGFDPNDLAITVALAIPMALYLARRRPAWLLGAALCCVAILLAASRTALIAAFVAFTLSAFLWRGSTPTYKAGVLAVLAILPLGTLWLAPKASRQRLATTTAEITRGTLHKRTQIWKAGVQVLKQHPIGGAGAGAYPDAVKPILGVPPIPGHEYVAHNTFLSVLVETGFVGAAIYGVLLVAIAVFIWVSPAPERWLWMVTLLVWAIGASLLTWEHRKPGWLLFALICSSWARAFRRVPE